MRTQDDTLQELFGELRAVLHATPGADAPAEARDEAMAEAWGELCAILELAHEVSPDRTRAEWFPYLDRALAAWPAHLRVVPDAWLTAPPTQPLHPGITLCRTLDLPVTLDAQQARRLVEEHELTEPITTLRVRFAPTTLADDWSPVAYWDAYDWYGEWRFDPRYPETPHPTRWLGEAIQERAAPWLPNLRALELVGGWFRPQEGNRPSGSHRTEQRQIDHAEERMRALTGFLSAWTLTNQHDDAPPTLETLRLCHRDAGEVMRPEWNGDLTWREGTLWDLRTMCALFAASSCPRVSNLALSRCEAMVGPPDADSPPALRRRTHDDAELALAYTSAWFDIYISPGPDDTLSPGWRKQTRPEAADEALRAHRTMRDLLRLAQDAFDTTTITFEGPCAVHRYPDFYRSDYQEVDDAGSLYFNEAKHAYYNETWE